MEIRALIGKSSRTRWCPETAREEQKGKSGRETDDESQNFTQTSRVLPPLPCPHEMHAIQRLPAGVPEDAHVLGRLLAAARAPRHAQDLGPQPELPANRGHHLMAAAAVDVVWEHAAEVARSRRTVKAGPTYRWAQVERAKSALAQH